MYGGMQQPLGMNSYTNAYQQLGQYNQTPPQIQSLTRVTGIDGAKAYQMNANSTVALFDSNEDIMYIKSTDGAGFPTIRQFKFSEVTQTELTNNSNDFVSREEFENFKKEMMEYGKQFIQAEPDLNEYKKK